MIQVYGRKKCKTTRKAERFFSERRIAIQSIDLDAKPPGRRELELFVQVLSADALLDTDGAAYSRRNLAYLEFDAAEEIAGDASLLRTPIVRNGRDLCVGDDPAGWARIAGAKP